MNSTKAVIFDWGDTVMRDFPEYKGPMANWPKVEMIAGIDTLLKNIPDGIVCCLASNAVDSDVELMSIALTRAGLRHYFRYLFTSHELNAKKPDPAFYIEILRRLNLKPENCVAVGNDYLKDIVPAKSIGMQTIWFSQHQEAKEASSADYLVNSMNISV